MDGGPGRDATIEREHVLRCNASGYHWQLAAESLPSHSRHVSSVSRWLLSHTVVPVTLAEAAAAPRGRSTGTRAARRPSTTSSCRPSSTRGASPVWAIHLGVVVSPLSAAEAALVSQLNEANPQLVLHRDRVAHVDYADFELLGDYREFCRRRHAAHFGR